MQVFRDKSDTACLLPPIPPLFSCYLDPIQTKAHPKIVPAPLEIFTHEAAPADWEPNRNRTYDFPKASSVESLFRHGSWRTDRELVRTALRAAETPWARMQRFGECGSQCRFERNTETGEIRMVANYCGDRFCRPCGRARASRIRHRVTPWLSEGKHSMLTLTLAQNEASLNSTIDKLYKSWVNLRRLRKYKRDLAGGALFVELTRGELGTHWHTHAHVLVRCPFLDWAEMRANWFRITGDSHVVNIRAVRDSAEGAWYAGKYATKGFDHTVLHSPAALVAAIHGLRSRRLVAPFGDWWNRPKDEQEPKVGEWVFLWSLETVLAAASRGELWAVGLACQGDLQVDSGAAVI